MMLSHFLLFVLAAQRSQASPTVSVAPYTYVGCWAEPHNIRALTDAFHASDSMTLEYCASKCAGIYEYWAVEYGRECYCGSTLSNGTLEAPAADCNTPCAGSSSEVCGAGDRLSLYRAKTPIPQASVVPIVGLYSFSSCQTEGIGTRALTGLEVADDSMTNELCASSCVGYIMFATEYGRKCYCGNTLERGSVSAPNSECDFPCVGNSLELCGAGMRLNLYTLRPTPSPTASGPGSTSSSTSISFHVSSLSTSSSVNSSTRASSSTILHQKNSSTSKQNSLSSTLAAHSQLTRSSSSSRPVSTPTPSTKPSSAFVTLSRRTRSPPKHQTQFSNKVSTCNVPLNTPSWSHVGCFSHIPGHEMHFLKKSHNMDPALCISAASARKTAIPATTYKYVGLEHGKNCYGATAAPYPIPTNLVGKNACTSTCRGNVVGGPVEMCGGWRQYDLYASETGKVFSRPVPTATPP